MLVLIQDIIKKTEVSKTALLLALVVCSLFLVSCRDELQPLQRAMVGVYNYGKVEARFCSSAPAPAQQKLKYLFIVDHSASNKPGLPLDPADVQNSDAEGSRRYGPMINFVRNLSPDPSTLTSFNIIDFHDTAYQPTGMTVFESDTDTFINNASQDWIGSGAANLPSPDDSGFTNYQDAFSLAEQIIRQDALTESVTQSGTIVTTVYQIILVTDGAPVVQASNGVSLYTQDFDADLKPVINNILDIKNNPTLGKYVANISINTAYYYNTNLAPSTDAVTLLEKIATAGNGLFLQFSSGQQILYQQFTPPSRNVLNQLADVFVENVNGVWWDDGHFMLDTDADGLPDAIEQQVGSNFNVYDSDGNGVSDLVEFRTKGRACDDPTCSAAARDPYAICAGYNPTTDASGNVNFNSNTNDGLNDCEKFLLNGSIQSFSSAGNLIPDLLAFKNTMAIQSGNANVALADPFADGLNNYAKLKLGLPVQVSKKYISNFESRVSNLVVESSAATGVTCYRLNVNKVALSGLNNKIKVYVIQNSSLIQDKPFLMTAEVMVNGDRNAIFQASDFR